MLSTQKRETRALEQREMEGRPSIRDEKRRAGLLTFEGRKHGEKKTEPRLRWRGAEGGSWGKENDKEDLRERTFLTGDKAISVA